MKRNSRVFVVGHNGMVGRALLRRLKKDGFSNIFAPKLDITDQKAVRSLFKAARPEYCFLAPVREGGIGANIMHPAELIYQNLAVQTNIIHLAWEAKVKRLLFLASSCFSSSS